MIASRSNYHPEMRGRHPAKGAGHLSSIRSRVREDKPEPQPATESEATMPVRDQAMTAKAFCDWLEQKELTNWTAAPILGVSHPQVYRYATGKTPIPETIARLIAMFDRHGIPRDWR